MRKSLLLGGLLSSVVIVTAFAQSNPQAPPAASPPPAASSTTSTTTASTSSMWRASKLVGLNVYNDQNEKLGDISEVLIDKSGKVEGVVIGVGGFLGMGQHDIKVEMSKLKFVDEPARSASTSTTTTTTTGTGANRPATTSTTTSSGKKWYPDHAVLSGATKDQLKAMPQFKFD